MRIVFATFGTISSPEIGKLYLEIFSCPTHTNLLSGDAQWENMRRFTIRASLKEPTFGTLVVENDNDNV